MTLQIALLGTDGLLLASDTRRLNTYPYEAGEVQTSEPEIKAILNSPKTVAAAWSGIKPSSEFIVSIIDVFGREWGKESSTLTQFCTDLWEEERPRWQGNCSFIVAHSNKREVYKASFSCGDRPRVTAYWESLLRSGLVNGHEGNPACFFIHKYLPKELVPIDNLVRWAAHYILMGGDVNPFGIGGLTIYTSKGGNPFEEIPEENILQLTNESNSLDRLTSGFLLTPLSAPDSVNLEFLKLP